MLSNTVSIKDFIPYSLKVKYHIFRMNRTGNPIYKIEDYPPGKKIFLFLAADYGNLGDVALTYAETEFLKRHFPDYTVVDIIIRNSVEGIHFAKKYATKTDIISIIGGGNMGDLYGGLEGIRRIIINTFPNHKIVSFPQSIHYSNTPSGQASLKEAGRIYGRHKKLVLVARDPRSFEIMQQHFPKNQVLLTPDIVFSQRQTDPVFPRNGVTLSLRRDIEKGLSAEQDKILEKLIQKHFAEITHYDTNIQRSYLSVEDKYRELHNIWNTYKRSRLVITDRLHGMIFCYITNTPCIVLLNNNHKIEFAYEWIKFSRSISLVKTFNENTLDTLLAYYKNADFHDDYQSLDPLFEPLIKAIQY